MLWYFSNISKWRFHFNYFVIVSFPSTLVFNHVFLIWLKNISILDWVQSTIVQRCQVFFYRTTFPALFWRSSSSNNFQFFLQLWKIIIISEFWEPRTYAESRCWAAGLRNDDKRAQQFEKKGENGPNRHDLIGICMTKVHQVCYLNNKS